MIALQESREFVAVTIPDGMTKQGSVRVKVYLGVQLIGKIFSKNKGFYYAVPTSNYAQVVLSFEYFPDLIRAVAFSFDLILNPTESSFDYDAEF